MGEEQPDEFAVTLQSMSGEAMELTGLQPNFTLGQLRQKAAGELEVRPVELKFILGVRTFENTDYETMLSDLGVEPGCQLTYVRRASLLLHGLGISRYNTQYFCTVHQIEEVDTGTLEVHFEVRGDMSMGPLQDARESRLLVRHEGSPSTSYLTPVSHTFEIRDQKRHIKGKLVYKDVPIEGGHVEFIYGVAGYSRLAILPATTGNDEDMAEGS